MSSQPPDPDPHEPTADTTSFRTPHLLGGGQEEESPRVDGPLDRARQLLHSTAGVLGTRGRVGARRARYSIIPALQMTLAAVGAYTIAEQLLGHRDPLFAAIAALIALGFSREPRLRKVIEVGIGCTLGIFIGDMVLHLLGRSILTASLVLFVAIMLARFLDRSPLLAMQMGLQSLLVVLIPAPEVGVFGPFSRSMDAVVGGVVAMLVALLTPRDPRREPIRELGQVVDELTACLRETAKGIRTSESRHAWHALIRSRAMQSQLDQASDAVASARELTLYSPAYRRHRHYVRRMDRVADQLDLAVRSQRVIARRAVGAIDHAALTDGGTASISQVMEDLADATALIARAVEDPGRGYRRRTAAAQQRLADVAARLHPRDLQVSTLEGEALVLLLRPMVIDLLVATGMPHEEAVEVLPGL